MTKGEVLEIWAPQEATWSRWVKPVLFTFMNPEPLNEAGGATRDWEAPMDPHTAVFADLPGAEGVEAGLALASKGYRPIPLYNACPHASVDSDANRIVTPTPAAVDVGPIVASLFKGAEKLRQLNLPASAPPAFLVDANRRGPGYVPRSGTFDNRSVVSALDVPSGALLSEQGVQRVILIQAEPTPQPDLLYVLLAWQQLGIQILFQRPWVKWAPDPVVLKRPSLLVVLSHKLSSAFGARRNEFGSFGAMVGHGG
jgi:hypothetical protein